MDGLSSIMSCQTITSKTILTIGLKIGTIVSGIATLDSVWLRLGNSNQVKPISSKPEISRGINHRNQTETEPPCLKNKKNDNMCIKDSYRKAKCQLGQLAAWCICAQIHIGTPVIFPCRSMLAYLGKILHYTHSKHRRTHTQKHRSQYTCTRAAHWHFRSSNGC